VVATLLAVLAAALETFGQPPPDAKRADAPKPEEKSEAKRVRVTAEGYNRDDALKQALRKALEQGAGVQIAGYSQTQDFTLVRDTIYSRAAGIVTDYRVLSERAGAGGTTILEVEATVRPDAVARAWGEVQNVLDQLGRPKIMVWIDERIDGQFQPDSMVETRIEELFVKAGFDLVTRKAVGDVARRELADARAERGLTRLQQIAKDAGAHILIRGAANADRAGLENIYGVAAAYYNCDVQAKVYYTDTARLLASESIPVTRSGVRSRREFSPQAAREALVQATFPPAENAGRTPALAIKLYEAVMEQWATQISAGGDIELEVRPLGFKAYLNIKKALTELEGIKSVEGDFTEGAARFRIKANLAASMLAELLTGKPFSDWLEITDLKLNRIRAKAVGSPGSQPAGP
jgi:copper chaperone CopZ